MTIKHQWSEKVKFHPWIGKDYFKQQPRWLILGESHYGGDNSDPIDSSFTNTVTKEYVDGANHPFWTKIANLYLEGNANRDKQSNFWHEVVFYNFVQEFAGKKSRQRPAKESWAKSDDAFKEVLTACKPTHTRTTRYVNPYVPIAKFLRQACCISAAGRV